MNRKEALDYLIQHGSYNRCEQCKYGMHQGCTGCVCECTIDPAYRRRFMQRINQDITHEPLEEDEPAYSAIKEGLKRARKVVQISPNIKYVYEEGSDYLE